MKSKHIWTCATIICHTIALILLLATVIGDSWANIQLQHGAHILTSRQVVTLNGEVIGRYGLWQYCTAKTSLCIRVNQFYRGLNPDWFKATQIAASTACMFGITAFVSSLLKPCHHDCASVIAALNMFLAWVCITGALAVFTVKEQTNDEQLMEKRVWGWTFIVGWSCSGMTFLASVVAWLGYTPRKEQPELDMFFIQP